MIQAKRIWRHLDLVESFGLAPLQIERQALAKANAAARCEAALHTRTWYSSRSLVFSTANT